MTKRQDKSKEIILEEVTQHLFEKIEEQKPGQIGYLDESIYHMILHYMELGCTYRAYRLAVAYIVTRYNMLQPEPIKHIGFNRDEEELI